MPKINFVRKNTINKTEVDDALNQTINGKVAEKEGIKKATRQEEVKPTLEAAKTQAQKTQASF
ncbi:MAG: hypothetical protein JJT76_06475 [Clostridiaceae bacterium]|nr:hypothetical protein [Clostridiaceae bacterium]